MARSKTYADAIALLNTCQSNAATIEAIRASGGKMNQHSIPEMQDYLRRIGYSPDDLNRLNVVHITGTKGKGSTSAFVERILRGELGQGSRIGLYTSPHLCAVRERIRINGAPLSEEMFAKYFFEVWERLEADPKTVYPHTPQFPIYFRLLTLLCFHTFLSQNITATILEVGIGGLYDSTNIVPLPITTGISSLGLDHTAVLGGTIEEIAKNKAGIYKKGVPALSVVQDYKSGEEVLRVYAEEVGAEGFEVVKPVGEGVELGLRGVHQRINAGLAVGLAKSYLEKRSGRSFSAEQVVPEEFLPLLKATKWPGRCQSVVRANVGWLLDGAHTVESLKSCGEWAWKEGWREGRKRVLVFNCSGGRAGEGLLRALLDAGREVSGAKLESIGDEFEEVVFCTNVTYTSGEFKGDLTSKAIDPNDLSQLATQTSLRSTWLSLIPTFSPERVHAVASIEHAVNIVKRLSEEEEVDVLVAGSLHLVGGVMEVAGLQDELSME